MKIKNIHVENYKTYRQLDLNMEVTDDRPIILIGGANGCGKTTLFDAIYHALYGLDVKTARQFEELFNAGVKNEQGLERKSIVLEVTFSGVVLGRETPYRLRRAYMLQEGKVLESVELNMNGNRFVYGSGSTASQRKENEAIVNKIIAGNLPAELSNYFLFDAMKTSDLVKEEQINKLIMNNINSVMGFNKYSRLQSAAASLLAERKAAKLENENQRTEYEKLQKERLEAEKILKERKTSYSQALAYANEYKEQYELVKEGRNADNVTRDKISKIQESIKEFKKNEILYRQDTETMAKELETKVLYPKLAEVLRSEIELLLAEKDKVTEAENEEMSAEQIQQITHSIVEFIEKHYVTLNKIDEDEITEFMKNCNRHDAEIEDKYPYLSINDIKVLENLIKAAYVNPFIQLDEVRNGLNNELSEMPQRLNQLTQYKHSLAGTDYSIIEEYESNDRTMRILKEGIGEFEDAIKDLDKKIATYDYDIPQVPDPQYDMLCKLPDFFKKLSAVLLKAKKANIERMMRDQLNINLVVYAGYIGRVELSSENSDEICFRIYHKNGNEIYLSQLNAGAKQTVMQVLLKVLYELGDYDPPVMIDTVMGVLDKESREVILDKYFPDLAHQTILLSTDTEITTERDFEKIQAFVAKTFTLHRDKELQCTTVTDDYFGLTPSEY